MNRSFESDVSASRENGRSYKPARIDLQLHSVFGDAVRAAGPFQTKSTNEEIVVVVAAVEHVSRLNSDAGLEREITVVLGDENALGQIGDRRLFLLLFFGFRLLYLTTHRLRRRLDPLFVLIRLIGR
jgi:hypothetical protein